MKLERLEERFAFGEIDLEIVEKVGGKLKQEIKSVTAEVIESGWEFDVAAFPKFFGDGHNSSNDSDTCCTLHRR